MELLDKMLAYYIGAAEAYIDDKNNNNSMLIKMFIPSEECLSKKKLESANKFLSSLNNICNHDNEDSSSTDENNEEIIEGEKTNLMSDFNNPYLKSLFIYTHSPIIFSREKNKYASEKSIEVVKNIIVSEQKHIESIRDKHAEGSYDGLLEIIKNNLMYMNKLDKSCYTRYHLVSAPLREGLILNVAVFLCALEFDMGLYSNKNLTSAKKNLYYLKSGAFSLCNESTDIIFEVKGQLKSFYNNLVAPYYSFDKGNIKIFIYYNLVAMQLERMIDIDPVFTDPINNGIKNIENSLSDNLTFDKNKMSEMLNEEIARYKSKIGCNFSLDDNDFESNNYSPYTPKMAGF